MPLYEFVGKQEEHRMVKNATPIRQILRLFGRKEPQEEERDVAKTFDRAAFIKSAEGSNVPLNEQNEAKRGVDSEQVKISGELNEQYTLFLKHYAKNMMELKKQPAPNPLPGGAPRGARTMFDLVLSEVDRKFFNELVDSNGEVDTSQIERMLETSEGWMLATSLMDQQRALTLAGLAIDAASRPDSNRVNLINSHRVHLGSNQGSLNRMWHNMTPAQRTGIITGGLLALGAGGIGLYAGGVAAAAAGGNVLLGAAGGAAANEALVGGVYGFLRSLQHGNTLDMRQCADTLKFIQDNPTLKLRMKAMANIDIDDYHVNANGRTELTPGRVPESANLRDSFRNALSLTASRAEFHTELGIDPMEMDANPEQWILRRTGTSESARTRLEDRIFQLYDPNNIPVGMPQAERIQRLYNARQKAMLESFQEMTDKLTRDELDSRMDLSISKIDQLLAELADDGVAMERVRAPLNREKQLLNELNEGIDGQNGLRQDVSTLEAYADAIRSHEQTLQEIAREFGSANKAAIEAELNQRTNVSPEKARDMREKLVQAQTEMAAQNAAGEQIDARFEAASTALDSLIGYDNVLAAGGLNRVGLNVDAIARLPINEIMARVNEANARGATLVPPRVLGWDASRNSDPIVRTALYLQIAEAQARQANVLVRTPSPEIQFCRAHNIGEHILRTAPLDEVARQLEAQGGLPAVGGLPAIPRPDINNPVHRQRLQNLVNEAQTRFTVRSNSFREVSRREQTETATLNRNAGAEKTRVEQTLNRDRQELTNLQQAETNLNNLRDLDRMTKVAFEAGENEYLDTFAQLERAHNILSARTPPVMDLDPTVLPTLTLDQIEARINASGGVITLPVDADARIRFLVNLKSEAMARESGGADFINPPAALTTLNPNGVSERMLRDMNTDDLENQLRRKGVKIDQSLHDQIVEAKAEFNARRNIRVATLRRNITDAATIPAYAEAPNSYLRLSGDFRTAETAFANQLARAGVASVAELQARIAANEARLPHMGEVGSLSAQMADIVREEETYGNAVNKLQAARGEISNSLGGITTLQELDRIVDRRTRIDETQLRTWIDALNQAETGLNGAAETQALITDLETQFDAFTDMGPDTINAHLPAADQIDEGRLQTLSVNELMTLVNRAHEASVAAGGTQVGWAERDNNNPTLRRNLLRAVSQAHARQEADIRFTPAELELRMALDNLTETQILRLTPEAALAEANRLAGANVYGAADIPTFTAAREQAQRRNEMRLRTFNGRIAAHENRIRDIDTELANPVEAVVRRRSELEIMKSTIQSRNERMAFMNTLMRSTDAIEMTQIVNPADVTLTESERTSGLPRGMIELYNVLFPYQDRMDRSAAFSQLIRAVPPDRLMDTFRRIIPAFGRVRTPVAFIRRLGDGIESGTITAYELRNVVREFSDRNQAEALALTLTA